MVGGVMMYCSRAPIPDRVTGPNGAMRHAKAPAYDALGTGAKSRRGRRGRRGNQNQPLCQRRPGLHRRTTRRMEFHRRALQQALRRRPTRTRLAEGGGTPANDLAASRQLAAHSYTNNWPYDKAAGNTATAGSMMWSAASFARATFPAPAVAIISSRSIRLRPISPGLPFPDRAVVPQFCRLLASPGRSTCRSQSSERKSRQASR